MPAFENAGYFANSHFFSEHQTPLRRVCRYELEWIEEGNGFSYIDGQQYPHQPGRLLLCRPGCQRFSVGSFRCYFVYFVAQNQQEAQLLNRLSPSGIADDAMIPQLILDLKHSKQHRDAYFHQQALLCTLLGEAERVLQPSSPQAQDGSGYLPAILEVKEYIDHHFDEPLPLDELAKRAHLSKNYFRTLFQQSMGLSPRDYLQQARLSCARRMLRTSGMPISQIASQCGFESQAYFQYVFKQHTGMTPLHYRQNKQHG